MTLKTIPPPASSVSDADLAAMLQPAFRGLLDDDRVRMAERLVLQIGRIVERTDSDRADMFLRKHCGGVSERALIYGRNHA